MATLRVMPGPVFGDVSDAFPAATQLAALGPVLCLYRTQQGRDADAGGLADRLWRRLASRLLGGQWRACVLHLHALPQPGALPVLAASLPLMSMLSATTAQRLAQAEGADLEGGPRTDIGLPFSSHQPSDASPAEEAREAGDNVIPLVRRT
jgi:hypothetical protein